MNRRNSPRTVYDSLKGLKVIDLHCHILPGLDDGAGNLEHSVQMARTSGPGRNFRYRVHAAYVALFSGKQPRGDLRCG